MRVTLGTSYRDVPADAWDAMVKDAPPFLEHAFLAGLEETGCATAASGWKPRPILVERDGVLVAGAPGWVKDNSFGEFVYDFQWANAAIQAGYPYYPKLVLAVPMTPVAGPRRLYRDDAPGDAVRQALRAGIDAASRGLVSANLLFPTEDEAQAALNEGYFTRIQFQYHWTNPGYGTFDDFLADFPSRDRNKIKRERREVAHLRFEHVTDPDDALMDAMYAFYADTTFRYFAGQRYLTPEFFRYLGRHWKGRLHLVIARDGDDIVAGAMNVRKGDRLWGRYWGATREIPFLHFEVCYYQAIEYAIQQRIRVFEPGHGGEHKYRRGFLPAVTWSAHRFPDPTLHQSFRQYCFQERIAVNREVETLTESSPLRSARERATE